MGYVWVRNKSNTNRCRVESNAYFMNNKNYFKQKILLGGKKMMDDRSILVRNPTKKSDLLANGVKRLQSDSVMGILYLLDCPLLNPMFV